MDFVKSLHAILSHYFKDKIYQLYLYGSRTQDHFKGGDIDLLIISDSAFVSEFKENQLDILVAIKKQKAFGQRKIDIRATTPSELESDPFLKSIEPQLVLLKC